MSREALRKRLQDFLAANRFGAAMIKAHKGLSERTIVRFANDEAYMPHDSTIRAIEEYFEDFPTSGGMAAAG